MNFVLFIFDSKNSIKSLAIFTSVFDAFFIEKQTYCIKNTDL